MDQRIPRIGVMVAIVAMAVGGAALAETPRWVHEVVCPMVGPFRTDSGPKGKSLEQILEDFRQEVPEWSVLPSLKTHPLCPLRRGCSLFCVRLSTEGNPCSREPWGKGCEGNTSGAAYHLRAILGGHLKRPGHWRDVASRLRGEAFIGDADSTTHRPFALVEGEGLKHCKQADMCSWEASRRVQRWPLALFRTLAPNGR